MKYRLNEDVSLNCPDATGRTPLNFTITSSNEEVARLLDRRTVNPNKTEARQARTAWAQLISLLLTDGATSLTGSGLLKL